MRYILFEDDSYLDLLPLTFTRPLYDLRIGIYTCLERWSYFLGPEAVVEGGSFRFKKEQPTGSTFPIDYIWINARFLPSQDWVSQIEALEQGQYLLGVSGELLCAKPGTPLTLQGDEPMLSTEYLERLGMNGITSELNPIGFRKLTDLYTCIPSFFSWDFSFHIRQFPSQPLTDPHTVIYGADNIWVGEGAKIEAAILHAEEGPIYIGPGATIQPGAIVMGGHSIGAGAVVAAGAKLRANSSIGTQCKVGGEIKNSLLSDYSNKGHDGYMGNAVLGIGCNWGAGTDCSNMKNTFSEVKQWSYRHQSFVSSGEQFCGTVMGDFSRTGIHTMLNTGTVIGVSAHVFGEGFPPKFVPSFSWGGHSLSTYVLEKALEGAARHLQLKGRKLTEQDKGILASVYEETSLFRSWE